MAPLTLPLTFNNSFWTQDYKVGLDVLYRKLEQGIDENTEILDFVKARIRAERQLATAFSALAPGAQGKAFENDDGASLSVAFRGLQQLTAGQGENHRSVAADLQEQVADPFEAWSSQHSERIINSKEDMLDVWLPRYQDQIKDVLRARELYITASHKADEAEDEAKAAGLNNLQASDHLTQAPERIATNTGVRRSATVADRVSQKLRDMGVVPRPPRMPEPKNTMEMFAEQAPQGSLADADGKSDGTITPKLDKGKEREHTSPEKIQPELPALTVTTHLVLGGASVSAVDISALLFRAQQEIGVRNVKVPVLGEYEHCFTGEEFVVWLKDNLDGLKGSLDNAEDAARTLTEEYNAVRKIGELGNKFEESPTAFYQFRPKAFNLQSSLHRAQDKDSVESLQSPIATVAATGLKRSNTMVSYLVKAVQSATAPGHPDESPYSKARREAAEADHEYRKATRSLDRHRCAIEERVEDCLKALQRWETDRLKAVQTVLLQFQGIVASITGPLAAANQQASLLVSSFKPEGDVKALIEAYRTGPFRPTPVIYESVDHDLDGCFGIDLRKWSGEGVFARARSISSMDELVDSTKDVPPALTGLLQALKTAYPKMEDDNARRKTWIYDVPLASVHHLRAMLNSLPLDMPMSQTVFEQYDAPILAGTVKLWLLELDPPVSTWEHWDDVRKLYPSVGAAEGSKAGIEEELKALLLKFPLIGLKVLEKLVAHLKELIDTTTTSETNDVYITKLALSMSRCVLRPRQETDKTIQSNHAPLFLADLIKHYDAVIPPTVEKKKKDVALQPRTVPQRKRTKPFDSRPMRRSIDMSQDPQKLLETQLYLKNPAARERSASGSGGRPSSFASPPRSPPLPGIPPPVDTSGKVTGNAGGLQTPGLSVQPPSPIVNLNDRSPGGFVPPPPPPPIGQTTSPAKSEDEEEESDDDDDDEEESEEESEDEPFVPPGGTPQPPAPPPVAAPIPTPAPIPASPAAASGLARNLSAGTGRVGGPRVAARGGGPRPPSSSGPRPPPGAASSARGGGPGSPRSSFSGRPGSPGGPSGARPRTPPDAKDYLPTKRGGRAAAGSFSRTKPSGEP